MTIRVRHFDVSVLRSFALAPESGDQRLRAHLARCSRCQHDVMILRATAPQTDFGASVTDDPLLRRILDDRTRGRRTILPAADTPRRRRLPLAAGIAAALLALVAGVRALMRPSEAVASATNGELRFTPARPARGATVAVTYHAPANLNGERTLVLRGLFRSTQDGAYDSGIPVLSVAQLTRQSNGEFRAAFTLPDSIWYAAFVVEDSAARRIDDNAGRMWDLLVAAPDGRPTYESIQQQIHHLMGRNWEVGFATARNLVALYPDSLGSWGHLQAFENWAGQSNEAAVRAQQRAVFDRFVGRTDGARLGMLAWYAQNVDTAQARALRQRLLREQPTDQFAVQWRLLDILGGLSKSHDTLGTIAAIDALWRQTADVGRRLQISNYTLGMIVLQTKRSDLIRTWSDRLIADEALTRSPRSTARWVAEQFMTIRALREEGLRRARVELSILDTAMDSDRGLGRTRDEARQLRDPARRILLGSIGKALLAIGSRGAGLDTLRLAEAGGWDLSLFHDIASARLAAGDTVGAEAMLARIAIDPTSQPSARDALANLLRANGQLASLASMESRAQSEMVQRVLADSKTQSLAAAHLVDTASKVYAFADLAHGKPTVVLFWSRDCYPAVQELPHADSMSVRLREDGVQTISIVEDPASPELSAFIHDLQMPVYHDRNGETGHAFNNWGTPAYYILDARGRLRFGPYDNSGEVLRRAKALEWSDHSDSSSR